MASKIKHSFKDGMLALIKGGWANRVARFCSYWAGKNGVDVLIPENPTGNSPCLVSLNIPNAAKLIANEMTTNMGIKFGQNAVPLELRLITKASGNDQVADYAAVYLPSLQLSFAGVKYTVGGVTAIADSGGWYKIGTRTTGKFYLNQVLSTATLEWGTSALSDDTKVSYFVGEITFDSTNGYYVKQFARAMGGNSTVTDGGESGGGEIPSDNITGTLTTGKMVKASGENTITDACQAPDDNHQLVTAPAGMDGTVNALPYITQAATSVLTAKIANSGIVIVDLITKKAIKGDNVKITVPSGTTLNEWDNVAVAADGTLQLDQTEYAYFDSNEQAIADDEIVATDGTTGQLKTTGIKLSDFLDAERKKIEDDALDFMAEDAEGNLLIQRDNIEPFETGHQLLGTDADGVPEEIADIPQAPASDKVLMVKAGATAPTFEDATESDGALAPFTVQAVTVTTAGTTTFSYAKIFLPATSMMIWQEQFDIQTGTDAGQIQALSGNWYRIYGLAAGDIYLVDASTYTNSASTTKKQLKFANTAATAPTFSRKIANINSTTFAVTQFAPTVDAQIEQPTAHSEITRINKNSAGEDDPTTDENDPNITAQASQFYHLDPYGWKRGVDYSATTTDAANKVNQSARAYSIQSISGVAQPVVSFSSYERTGFRLQVFTRVQRLTNTYDIFFWRWLIFDKNGCLNEITGEKGCFMELNKGAY